MLRRLIIINILSIAYTKTLSTFSWRENATKRKKEFVKKLKKQPKEQDGKKNGWELKYFVVCNLFYRPYPGLYSKGGLPSLFSPLYCMNQAYYYHSYYWTKLERTWSKSLFSCLASFLFVDYLTCFQCFSSKKRLHLDEVKKEEEELLETESIPLRNYLMKHVMPTLSKGLVECTKIRPEDPIDFLVRTQNTLYYTLFKHGLQCVNDYITKFDPIIWWVHVDSKS